MIWFLIVFMEILGILFIQSFMTTKEVLTFRFFIAMICNAILDTALFICVSYVITYGDKVGWL